MTPCNIDALPNFGLTSAIVTSQIGSLAGLVNDKAEILDLLAVRTFHGNRTSCGQLREIAIATDSDGCLPCAVGHGEKVTIVAHCSVAYLVVGALVGFVYP